MKLEEVRAPLQVERESMHLGQSDAVGHLERATQYHRIGIREGSMRLPPSQLQRKTSHGDRVRMLHEDIQLLHVKVEELRYNRSLKESLDRLLGASGPPSCAGQWKKIASSEKYAQGLAQAQNLHLRQRLSRNVKYLQRVKKLLLQRQVVELTVRMPPICCADRDHVYYELKNRLNSRQGKIDVLLQQYEDAISICKPDYNAFDVNAGGPVTETKLSTLKPFDVSTINDAIWRYTRQSAQTYRTGTDVFFSGIAMRTTDLPSDLRAQFALESEEADRTFRTWCLLRRFVLQNQLVLMWETLREFEHERVQPPFIAHESGWAVIKSLEEFDHRVSLTYSTVSLEILPQHRQTSIQRIIRACGAAHERVMENLMMDSMRQR